MFWVFFREVLGAGACAPVLSALHQHFSSSRFDATKALCWIHIRSSGASLLCAGRLCEKGRAAQCIMLPPIWPPVIWLCFTSESVWLGMCALRHLLAPFPPLSISISLPTASLQEQVASEMSAPCLHPSPPPPALTCLGTHWKSHAAVCVCTRQRTVRYFI